MDCWSPDDRPLSWWQCARIIIAFAVACWAAVAIVVYVAVAS
jgi:hypothetical protein